MIAYDGDIESSLAKWLKPAASDGQPLFTVLRAPSEAIVEETEKSGEAQVTIAVPAQCSCIVWGLNKTGFFGFLAEDKNADGALLFRRSNGTFDVLIIECKKTVDDSQWQKAVKQHRWTLAKLLAIAAVLGIKIDGVRLGTAYRYDRLSEEESSEPARAMPLLEDQDPEISAAVNKPRRRQREWMTGRIHLEGFSHSFPHAKIKLDEQTGRGSYVLP